MASDLAHYVVRFFRGLMTEDERQAYRHLTAVYKATDGRTDSAAQAEAAAMPVRSTRLTQSPAALTLATDGLDAFLERVASRILRQHPSEVSLNRCPRCDTLTRTPTARLCLACGHAWHATTGP